MDGMRRLSRKQEKAILALVSSKTVEDAAKVSGIGRATLFKWLQEDVFKNAYRQARSEIVRHAIVQAQSSCSEAVNVLKEIMNSSKSPASTRVSAAKAVLETSIKAVEVEDLISRIEKIEAHLEKKK
jgi:hypothetical protein